MPLYVDLDTFVLDLRQSEILTEEAVNAILAAPEYAGLPIIELAQKLVHDKKLTAFQASCVLQGRWQDLVYGQFRGVRILHVGGIGYVLLAQQKNVPGWFAVKALKPEFQFEQAIVDMFRLEANAVTTLRHPNIVRGTHYGANSVAGTGYFLAMEFVAGPNLGELVAITQVTWQQACDIIAQSARGLQHAHERHYLHRDVKPGNIIVDRSGIAKLIDFGFVKYVGPDPIFPAAPDRRPGTAAFVAPERLIGDKSHSFPADIYSLGMTFYFALTGQKPFPRKSQRETLRAQVNSQPLPIHEFAPEVPQEVVAIFERMTAKQPQERYSSMAEVADALAPFSQRTPVDMDLRALLQARSRTQSQTEVVGPSQMTSSVLSEGEASSQGSRMSLSGVSQLRELEDGVRKIADELASQRARNQRLADRLTRRAKERAKSEELQQEMEALRQALQQQQTEKLALREEADRARKTISELRSRCSELEVAVESQRQKVETLNARLRELTSLTAQLQQPTDPIPEATQVLRSAYEEAHSLAQPLILTTEDASLLDAVWAEEDLFAEFSPRNEKEASVRRFLIVSC